MLRLFINMLSGYILKMDTGNGNPYPGSSGGGPSGGGPSGGGPSGGGPVPVDTATATATASVNPENDEQEPAYKVASSSYSEKQRKNRESCVRYKKTEKGKIAMRNTADRRREREQEIRRQANHEARVQAPNIPEVNSTNEMHLPLAQPRVYINLTTATLPSINPNHVGGPAEGNVPYMDIDNYMKNKLDKEINKGFGK